MQPVETTLDVVIPTLNAGTTLANTLAALQGDLPIAIAVCDGGSTDDTAAIARQAGATVVTAPAGRGGQLAAGANVGDASWILFLHADTVLAPGWANAIRAFTSRQTNIGKAGYFRLRFNSADPRARRVERLAAWRSRRLGLPYGDQGLLIARALYEYLDGFKSLPLMEDVDFVRRVGRKNLVPLDADSVTSAARYERDGWVMRPLRNLSCLALYLAGMPPGVVARLYGR
ncbi:MAG: TIGR04283 family arsenosugar biosynthesis glycosyltransferase [Reyranella sp.]|nr:TIGR04283 family arsenosugar biosynthesis glycosyltransferase [Reyranella sp.]MDP2373183.1 TIGR04283 family arsenosugar biosynthesis glycosyltransferase [Reyranella sp.]